PGPIGKGTAMTTRHVDTGTDLLLFSVSDHIAIITLNCPDKKNALGDILTPALRQAILDAERDSDVRVIVLTGAADAFCAGGDISGMGDNLGGENPPTTDEMIRILQQGQEGLSLRLHDCAKPTIAALPGPAAGAGMSIALACDLRVAADTAFIVPAFARIGLSGDYGGSWFLQRLVGPARAKEIYYTNRRIGAEEGLALGLFNRVVPADTLMSETNALAAEIAAGPPVALRYMKENHNRAQVSDLKTTLAMEADRMVRSMQTEDHKRAVRAFFSKENPTFEGR
ncbi:MAG: enoyl-CoA hydratase, partial [Paracoccaceae bacterium]